MRETRANVVIDDELIRKVLVETGLKTEREAVVHAGLETLLRLKRQERLRGFRGKLEWQGDLDAMRRDR